MEIEELYHELIVDHYKNPRHRGALACADTKAALFNPLCGDEITLEVKFAADGTIAEIGFGGHGCAISQASASLMSDACSGCSSEKAREYLNSFKNMLQGQEITEQQREQLGDIVALEGVKRFPMRVKCAALAWEALEKCLADRQIQA